MLDNLSLNAHSPAADKRAFYTGWCAYSVVPLDPAVARHAEAVVLDALRGAGGEPVLHEEIEVAEGAADAGVGGDERLVARAELGDLGLVPDARAAVGVDVLGVDLGVEELDDPLSL